MTAITAAELLWKYSTTAGSAGNSGSGTASGSLGKYISTTQIPDATLNALYDDISGAENAASTVDYRGTFLHNSNGANVAENAGVYISSEVAGGASIALAASGTAASAIGSATAQMETIANETTAPSGPAFTSPTTAGSAVSLGNISTGNCKGVWVRRTAANNAALSADGVTLAFICDTGSL